MPKKYTCQQDECVAPICFTHTHTHTHAHTHSPGNSLLMRSVLMPAYTLKHAPQGNQGGMGSWVGWAQQLSFSLWASARANLSYLYGSKSVGLFVAGSPTSRVSAKAYCGGTLHIVLCNEESLCKSNATINRFGYSVCFLHSSLGVSSGSAELTRAHLFAQIE